MKLVIFLGALVIFISCFFIFFIFDSLIKTEFVCSFKERLKCNVTELNMTIVFGILVVGILLFLDVLIVYIMIKMWVPDLFMYGFKKQL